MKTNHIKIKIQIINKNYKYLNTKIALFIHPKMFMLLEI